MSDPDRAAQRTLDYYRLNAEAFRDGTRDHEVLRTVHEGTRFDDALVGRYPAHLHIDLLPETQGKGLGRALIETLFAELRRRGVRGLHLGMDPANSGAAAFYERIGLVRLAESADGLTYGISFS